MSKRGGRPTDIVSIHDPADPDHIRRRAVALTPRRGRIGPEWSVDLST
jgi:hypothetical protein